MLTFGQNLTTENGSSRVEVTTPIEGEDMSSIEKNEYQELPSYIAYFNYSKSEPPPEREKLFN